MLKLFVLATFAMVLSRPPYLAPRKPDPDQRDWWHDLGNDWETTDDLEENTASLAAFNYMKKQMDTYGYAQHIGTINRGKFLNPELQNPRDRAFGYGGDFNPGEFNSGTFRYNPLKSKHHQNVYASQAMVNLGMAKKVGEIAKVPTGILPQSDGSVLLTLDQRVPRYDPCTPNPCDGEGFHTFTCEVVNHFTVKCSKPASYDITLQWYWNAAPTKLTTDRESYLALGVTAVKKTDPTVTCAVVSNINMLSGITPTPTLGPKCGVTISDVDVKSDAAGNIISGGINIKFGQVASDSSNYQDYTYAIIAYYYCNDLTPAPVAPAAVCVAGIHEAADRVKLVKSYGGGVQESLAMPKTSKTTRKKRDTDPNPDNKNYFFWGIFGVYQWDYNTHNYGFSLNTYRINFYTIWDYVFGTKTLADADLAAYSNYPATSITATTSTYCVLNPAHTMCRFTGPSATCNAVFRQLDQTAKDLILSKHNELRTKVALGNEAPQPAASNMRKLVWNDELETIAQRWADQCPTSTNPHDDVRNKLDDTPVGQNVYFASSSAKVPDADVLATMAAPVQAWYDEVTTPGFTSTNINPFVFVATVGHYTQVVWADTDELGCGLVYYEDSGFRTVLVCNYATAGNVVSGSMYTEGVACADCPATHAVCSATDGLCSTS